MHDSRNNVDMYKYAKFYQNIPCGSRVISIFANCEWTDVYTHTVIIVLSEASSPFCIQFAGQC